MLLSRPDFSPNLHKVHGPVVADWLSDRRIAESCQSSLRSCLPSNLLRFLLGCYQTGEVILLVDELEGPYVFITDLVVGAVGPLKR